MIDTIKYQSLFFILVNPATKLYDNLEIYQSLHNAQKLYIFLNLSKCSFNETFSFYYILFFLSL